jgi:deoxyribonuclease-4
MNREAIFGVSGNPPNFWVSPFRRERANAPEWVRGIGLDALEIQCTHGVRMPDDRAGAFRLNSGVHRITLSIHGPYYISLGSRDSNKVDNSLNELRKCVDLAKKIGSTRVIFHAGGIDGNAERALATAVKALQRFEDSTDLGDVRIYPEIAGKVNSIGSLEDVIAICREVKCASPCIDFAHLHARTQGSLRSKTDFVAVFDRLRQQLGQAALELMHVHFYPIEWSRGGEVRHRAFDELNGEEPYFPRYEPFLDALLEQPLAPIIISEAKNSQDTSALEMQCYYRTHRSQAP